MARFLLTPCRVREDRVIADGDPVELDWPKMTALLAPSKSLEALMTLRKLKTNTYVGLLKHAPHPGLGRQTAQAALVAPPTNFVFQNKDPNSNNIGWLLKKMPTFSDSLKAFYRVDVAAYDAKFEESSGTPE